MESAPENCPPIRHDLKSVPDPPEIVVEDVDQPLIPAGDYQAKYLRHETALVFGKTSKVYVHFEIVDPGQHNGTKLYRAFRVTALIGKPRRNGRFKLKRRSDLFLTLCRLFDGKHRPDQVSLTRLRNLVLKISVRTVTKDYNQRPLPEMLHYSVVDEIKEIVAGNTTSPSLSIVN